MKYGLLQINKTLSEIYILYSFKCYEIMKRKLKQWSMVNNSTKINKTNNPVTLISLNINNMWHRKSRFLSGTGTPICFLIDLWVITFKRCRATSIMCFFFSQYDDVSFRSNSKWKQNIWPMRFAYCIKIEYAFAIDLFRSFTLGRIHNSMGNKSRINGADEKYAICLFVHYFFLAMLWWWIQSDYTGNRLYDHISI